MVLDCTGKSIAIGKGTLENLPITHALCAYDIYLNILPEAYMIQPVTPHRSSPSPRQPA